MVGISDLFSLLPLLCGLSDKKMGSQKSSQSEIDEALVEKLKEFITWYFDFIQSRKLKKFLIWYMVILLGTIFVSGIAIYWGISTYMNSLP